MVLSKAETKRWKVFDRLGSFFRKGKGVSAAQPNNEPVLKTVNESQILDECDQSMDLEDLNEKDRILSEILEKTEAKNCALTQQLAEMHHLQAQILTKLRAYYHVKTMSIPCQETTISANATITISNDTILESVMPPPRDMGVDPIYLNTTTMGIADTLPIYNADDNGLLEDNPCTSDTKDEVGECTLNFKVLLFNKLRIEKSNCRCCNGS